MIDTNFLACIRQKNKAKVFIKGNSLDALVMTTSICNAVAEKIAEEKSISLNDAIKFLSDCIMSASDTLK